MSAGPRGVEAHPEPGSVRSPSGRRRRHPDESSSNDRAVTRAGELHTSVSWLGVRRGDRRSRSGSSWIVPLVVARLHPAAGQRRSQQDRSHPRTEPPHRHPPDFRCPTHVASADASRGRRTVAAIVPSVPIGPRPWAGRVQENGPTTLPGGGPHGRALRRRRHRRRPRRLRRRALRRQRRPEHRDGREGQGRRHLPPRRVHPGQGAARDGARSTAPSPRRRSSASAPASPTVDFSVTQERKQKVVDQLFRGLGRLAEEPQGHRLRRQRHASHAGRTVSVDRSDGSERRAS